MKIFLYNLILIPLSLEIILIDAIYNLAYNNLLLTYINKKLEFKQSHLGSIISGFRIKKYKKKKLFYIIEYAKTNDKISVSKNNEIISDIIKSNDFNKLNLWSFIITENNKYLIKNKNKCFMKVKDNNIICANIPKENASQFKLIKIYEEAKENKKDNDLIEKEPIDILIKYIDLRDPNLNRNKIHQIKKDYDNEELKYSIRSILKNIPWIRKIFILMPNKKVRYFKEYNEIKEKIVYIKDKDLLGFDSSSSIVFQFNYWKLKKFGISNNFIIMDDDYFIGRPLKKTDFFYIKNNKIIPLIINNRFKQINKEIIEKHIPIFQKTIKETKSEQTRVFFQYSLYLTFLFILNIFKKSSLIVPKFAHNAIPVNINEIKEIYDLVFNSQYKSSTLFSTYRSTESLQFQTFVFSYTFVKYNKKVKNLSSIFIANENSLVSNYNYDLFCINTNGYHYTNLSFLKTRIVMEYLFPEISPYEKIDYSTNYISFKLVSYMNKELEKKKKDEKKFKIKEENIKQYRKKIKKLFLNLAYTIILLLCKKYKNF